MATKQHSTLTGDDLHVTKVDPTTGTELTPASQTTYDNRYVRTIGGTITPTSNSTTTLKVTKADGTTQVFNIDTTNARVGVGTASPSETVDVFAADATLRLSNNGENPQGFYAQSYQSLHIGLRNISGSTVGAIPANTKKPLFAINQNAVIGSTTHNFPAAPVFRNVLDDGSGKMGVNTAGPTAQLDVNGNTIRLRTSKTPSSASDTGNAGDICWDSNYIYICVATNTWKRAAIATW